jgi:tetratricopeptide (TPR) repeat protein
MDIHEARVVLFLLASALVQLVMVSPAAGQSELADRQRVQPYLALVAECRNGRSGSAVTQLLELPDLEATLAALQRLEPTIVSTAATSGDIEWRDIDAAILLHTGTAAVASETARPASVEQHLRAAVTLVNWRETVDAIRARSGEPPVDPAMNRRDWALATILAFTRFRELGRIASLTDAAAKRFPRDAAIQLAAGAVDELRAWSQPGTSARMLLGNAADRYRAAVAADPKVYEATLRLGRVRTLQGQHDDGAACFEQVLKSDADVGVRYLAHLFLGADMERRGRPSAAVPHYQAAVTSLPNTQSARTALAFALVQTGRADEARTVVEAGLRPGRSRGPLDDPFWGYWFGPMIAPDPLFQALLKTVAR